MKLGLLTRVISLGVFCSSVFVNAKKAVELEGIIKNYSNVPNSSLVVEAQFKCRIQDVLGWYKPCGDQSATSAVTPDGRFHMPDLHAGDDLVVGRLVAEFTYELKVTATNEEGKTVYLLSKSVDYNSASDLRKLSQYSLYQIPAQRITFAPLSGGSSAGWVAGEGR
ncbi:MAG TPA: hypothetical protein PLU50_06530, partial [Pseudobdellovibrionaceae bacterium]|nr:hypothetical protein [Pseudobdellovibrionaceae bacterium]